MGSSSSAHHATIKQQETSRNSENLLPIAQYEVLLDECLGRGSFGKVFKVYDTKSRQAICAKCVDNGKDDGKKTDERKVIGQPRRELLCLILGQKHPNIVKCLDFVVLSGKLWIFMEYCVHGDVYRYLKKLGKKMDLQQLLSFARDMSAALVFLHRDEPPFFPVTHRDIKLANYLLQDVDGRMVVKLADFGLSLINKSPHVFAVEHEHVGTRGYMAPEVYSSSTSLHYRTSMDIYSLGVVYAVMMFYDGDEKELCPRNSTLSTFGQDETSHINTMVMNCSQCNLLEQLKILVTEMTAENPGLRPNAQHVYRIVIDLTNAFDTGDHCSKHRNGLEKASIKEDEEEFFGEIYTSRSNREFLEAALLGDIGELKRCVRAGAEVTCTDEQGYTALHRAAENGHLSTVKYLVRTLGMDIYAEDRTYGHLPIDIAGKCGHCDVVEYFVSLGVPPL